MTNRDPHKEDILSLNGHVLPFRQPASEGVSVIVDCQDREVFIERGKESCLIKETDLEKVIAVLGKARDLFRELDGK